MLTTPWTSPPRDSPRGEPDKQGYGPDRFPICSRLPTASFLAACHQPPSCLSQAHLGSCKIPNPLQGTKPRSSWNSSKGLMARNCFRERSEQLSWMPAGRSLAPAPPGVGLIHVRDKGWGKERWSQNGRPPFTLLSPLPGTQVWACDPGQCWRRLAGRRPQREGFAFPRGRSQSPMGLNNPQTKSAAS